MVNASVQLTITLIAVAAAVAVAAVMAVKTIRRNMQCRDIRCAGCTLYDVCKKQKRLKEGEKVDKKFGHAK